MSENGDDLNINESNTLEYKEIDEQIVLNINESEALQYQEINESDLSDNSIRQDSDICMADDTQLDTQTWIGPPLKKLKRSKVKIVSRNLLKKYNKYLKINSGTLFIKITLLCVKSPWREGLVNGLKKYEFRSKNNIKHINDLVYIVQNRKAYGTVVFGNTNKILILKPIVCFSSFLSNKLS